MEPPARRLTSLIHKIPPLLVKSKILLVNNQPGSSSGKPTLKSVSKTLPPSALDTQSMDDSQMSVVSSNANELVETLPGSKMSALRNKKRTSSRESRSTQPLDTNDTQLIVSHRMSGTEKEWRPHHPDPSNVRMEVEDEIIDSSPAKKRRKPSCPSTSTSSRRRPSTRNQSLLMVSSRNSPPLADLFVTTQPDSQGSIDLDDPRLRVTEKQAVVSRGSVDLNRLRFLEDQTQQESSRTSAAGLSINGSHLVASRAPDKRTFPPRPAGSLSQSSIPETQYTRSQQRADSTEGPDQESENRFSQDTYVPTSSIFMEDSYFASASSMLQELANPRPISSKMSRSKSTPFAAGIVDGRIGDEYKSSEIKLGRALTSSSHHGAHSMASASQISLRSMLGSSTAVMSSGSKRRKSMSATGRQFIPPIRRDRC